MRIVNQGKGFSFDFDKMILWVNDDTITATIEGRAYQLGVYKSADRAQEVFDEINKSYNTVKGFSVIEMTETGEAYHTYEDIKKQSDSQLVGYLYYMPEE